MNAGSMLATNDRKDFRRLEGVIESGRQTFWEVGKALAEINARRLYRETHGNFADYCKERWGFSKSQGYRLIDAAAVAENLSPIGDVSALRESHVRELAALTPEDQRAVLLILISKGELPTASDVADSVEDLINRINGEEAEALASTVGLRVARTPADHAARLLAFCAGIRRKLKRLPDICDEAALLVDRLEELVRPVAAMAE